MTLIIQAAHESCTYTDSNGRFALSGAIDAKHTTVANALIASSIDGLADGKYFWARVNWKAGSNDWSIMRLQYNAAGQYAERISTFSGTKGSASVNFEGGALEIYGVYVESKIAASYSLTLNATLVANTPKKLVFDLKEYDTWNDVVAGTYTEQNGGLRRISGMLRFSVASANDMCSARIYKNGSFSAVAWSVAPSTPDHSVYFDKVFELQAGDTIEIYAVNVDNADTISNTIGQTYFQVTEV